MKKKVLGLLMAAVLCLCLLPVGAAAETVNIKPDYVNDDGKIIEGNFTVSDGTILTDTNTDVTLSGQYYIVQNDVTISGDLTVNGSQAGGLVLCANATLTVNGALIHTGGNSFFIYGQTNEGNSSSTGKLIIQNSSGTGAAIRSTGNNSQLGISSGALELHGGSAEKLVEGVQLYSEYKIHKGTLDGNEVLPSAWSKNPSDEAVKGSKLVLAYCKHNDADTVWIMEDAVHCHWQCNACGFTSTTKVQHEFRPVAWNEATHTMKCNLCGYTADPAEHSPEPLQNPAPTLDGKGHTTTACGVCGYSSGEPKAHTYNETGECETCGFTPVFEDNAGNLYDFSGSDSIKDLNKAIANGVTSFKLVNFAEGEGADAATVKAYFSLETDKAVTLDMNGKTLTYGGGESTLTVSNGTLTVKGDATITQTGQSQETVKSAVKVTGGELIFENDVNATGGQQNSYIAPAIEVTGGKVVFEGKVTATGGYYSGNSNKAEQKPAIYATGGELDFQGDLNLNGGLTLLKTAKLTNKLTRGTFWTEGSAGNSIDVYGVSGGSEKSSYSTCLDLLANGYAFAEYDKSSQKAGSIYSASRTNTGTDAVTVVTHTHGYQEVEGKPYRQCDCGVTCSHVDTYTNGKCSVCGYECPHSSVNQSSGGQESVCTCAACGTRMAVMSVTGETKTYGTDFAAAMSAATDGTTITLLDNIDNSGKTAYITGNDKTVTLNLNGHTISEGWIRVGIGSGEWSNPSNFTSSRLNIVDSGSFNGYLGVGYKATLDLSSWGGGENDKISTVSLSKSGNDESTLTVGESAGTIGTLGAYNWPTGTETINYVTKTKLSGGTYGAISITPNSDNGATKFIPFSSMLEKDYAFQYVASGEFVLHDTKVSNGGGSIYNVKVVECPHSGIEVADDGTAACKYCGKTGKFVASVDGNLYTDWNAAITDWLDYDTHHSSAGKLVLYGDYEATAENITWTAGSGTGAFEIDLNGHKMIAPTGSAFKPANNMALTIKDSSEKKNGSISSILVDRGKCQGLTLESGCIDSLTVQNCAPVSFVLDGGSVGTLTVEDYATNGIMLKGGSLGAYTLPGNTVLADIMDGSAAGSSNYYAEGTSLEKPADTAADHSLESFAIKTAPESLNFAAGVKTERVSVNGDIPFKVTPNNSTLAGVYTETWYRRTDTSVVPMTGKTVTGVNASETPLDVFCVITGWSDGSSTATVKWQMSFKNYQLTVIPASLNSDKTEITITNADALVYTGQELKPEVKVTYNGTVLKAGTDYTISGNTGTDAKTYTLTVTGKGNYGDSKTAEWTIKQHPIFRPTTSLTITKPYDGTATVSTDNLVGNSVAFESKAGITGISKVTLTKGTDFTISGESDDNGNANVGGHSTKITIALKPNGNYIFSQTTEPYEVQINQRCEITKAAAPTAKTGELEVVNNLEREYLIDPAELLPTLPKGCEFGNISNYAWNIAEEVKNYYGTGVEAGTKSENGKILLLLTVPATTGKETEGKIGTVTYTVTTQNYGDITLTVNVKATNKILPTGAPTLSSDKLTYGEALSKITLSGKLHDDVNNKDVEGTFDWVDPDTKLNAGTHEVKWKFTPKIGDTYAETDGTVTIIVNKATPSGAPKYTAITASGKTLADAKLTVNESWPEGTVQWMDADGKTLADTTEVKANTAYKWVFTPTDKANYNTATGSITLYSVSTGGGGGGSSTTTKTETTTNPDGSVTKTETRSDGTVIETTTNPDGSVSKTESKTTTKSNGSTVETVTETNTGADGSKSTSKTETTTNKDGSKTETKTETKTAADGTKSETKSETKTDANGVTNGKETTKTTAPNGSTGTTTTTTENGNTKTEAEAKISNKAVEDAKKSGEAVKVPTEVKAGEDSNSAPTVKVELPKNAGETKIEIPVEDVNSGTVAVIVHEDGTEELVKDSKPTEDGVQLTVDGSATVKIIDNSKDFIDTRDHWSRDEVNFVVAREIFNGVGNDLFGVNQPMTRGMVNTVLARLAGVDTTPSAGQKWYEVGTAWAKANGITDGTNPEASVTREQLATLLYRFSGTPEVKGSLQFNDAHEVSAYAQDALLWAVQNGILNGVGNNCVAPSADAQRAQVAAMMARYLKNAG